MAWGFPKPKPLGINIILQLQMNLATSICSKCIDPWLKFQFTLNRRRLKWHIKLAKLLSMLEEVNAFEKRTQSAYHSKPICKNDHFTQ
jgi:hypothetical protein